MLTYAELERRIRRATQDLHDLDRAIARQESRRDVCEIELMSLNHMRDTWNGPKE